MSGSESSIHHWCYFFLALFSYRLDFWKYIYWTECVLQYIKSWEMAIGWQLGRKRIVISSFVYSDHRSETFLFFSFLALQQQIETCDRRYVCYRSCIRFASQIPSPFPISHEPARFIVRYARATGFTFFTITIHLFIFYFSSIHRQTRVLYEYLYQAVCWLSLW